MSEREACVLLASTSPRRRQILDAAGIPFRLVAPGPEPSPTPDMAASVTALAHARSKALGASVQGLDGLLLAVDTVVTIDDRVLGKPRDRAQAASFLDLLCGREHEVWTAHVVVPVASGRVLEGTGDEALERSVVAFGNLTDAERTAYLDTEDWIDKAGGYGIQSKARGFARVVAGDHDTVVGLTSRVVCEMWSAYRSQLDGGSDG